jgi:hypothetical protein
MELNLRDRQEGGWYGLVCVQVNSLGVGLSS